MARLSTARLLALSLALSSAPALAQDGRDGGLVVGALRPDARAHSFARFTGKQWQAAADADALPERWWLMPLDAGARQEVRRTSDPTVPEDDCDGIGLFRTDAEAGYVEPNTCPVEKVGLLFSKPVPVFPILEAAADDSRKVAEHVAGKVAEFESRTARDVGDLGLTPMGVGCRKKAAGDDDADAWSCEPESVSMRVAGVHPPGLDRKFFHVSYTRKGRRKRLSQYECGDTFYTGWLMEAEGKLAAVHERFYLPDCDYKTVDEFERPLLGFAYAGRVYLVSQFHGWESEDHGVSELTEAGIVRLARRENHGF